MKKIIEVNLGIGLNQFFPEPVKILIEDDETNEIGDDNNLNDNIEEN